MLQVLDVAAIRRWTDTSVDLLDSRHDELDRINVFPVPDSDTGTNLLLTVRAAADALARWLADRPAGDAAGAAAALARGALRGARGNSGVIVSQLYRGLAEVLSAGAPESDTASTTDGTQSGPELARALERADELARAAVSKPVEGTVLSVLTGAAASAHRANGSSGTLGEVASAALRGAREALADTPRQLPVLARAGVVDAGGLGLTLLLQALCAVVTGATSEPEMPGGDFEVAAWDSGRAPGGPGRAPGGSGQAPGGSGQGSAWAPGRDRDALVGEREGGSSRYEYEVMYLLTEAAPERIGRLRARLDELGDSVAVVGSGAVPEGEDEVWNVHVHCTDVGAAIEAGVVAGRPRRITVIRFLDQVGEPVDDVRGRFARSRAVVAIVPAEAVAGLLAADGVAVLVARDAAPADAARIAAAVAGTRARHVVLLPNDPTLTTLAEGAAELARASGQETVVVPTSSVLQELAALAVHDPTRRAEDDVVAMAEAAAATRTGVVRLAETEALTWVGRCQAGDVLGLIDGEVVLIAQDLTVGARLLVERMLHAGGELVTVLLGEGAPAGLAETLEDHLRHIHPEVDLVFYSGGPAGQPVAVGVE